MSNRWTNKGRLAFLMGVVVSGLLVGTGLLSGHVRATPANSAGQVAIDSQLLPEPTCKGGLVPAGLNVTYGVPRGGTKTQGQALASFRDSHADIVAEFTGQTTIADAGDSFAVAYDYDGDGDLSSVLVLTEIQPGYWVVTGGAFCMPQGASV